MVFLFSGTGQNRFQGPVNLGKIRMSMGVLGSPRPVSQAAEPRSLERCIEVCQPRLHVLVVGLVFGRCADGWGVLAAKVRIGTDKRVFIRVHSACIAAAPGHLFIEVCPAAMRLHRDSVRPVAPSRCVPLRFGVTRHRVT